MKNDALFKLAAAIILAGVITAFVAPAPAAHAKAAPAVAHADSAPTATTSPTE